MTTSLRITSLLAGVTLAGGLVAGCELDGDTDDLTMTTQDLVACYQPPSLPYQSVQMRSIHNAYTRAESIFDQFAFHRVRNQEWDIRSQPVTNIYGPARDDNDWYVYHSVSESRRCDKLSDCLTLLKGYHDAV